MDGEKRWILRAHMWAAVWIVSNSLLAPASGQVPIWTPDLMTLQGPGWQSVQGSTLGTGMQCQLPVGRQWLVWSSLSTAGVHRDGRIVAGVRVALSDSIHAALCLGSSLQQWGDLHKAWYPLIGCQLEGSFGQQRGEFRLVWKPEGLQPTLQVRHEFLAQSRWIQETAWGRMEGDGWWAHGGFAIRLGALFQAASKIGMGARVSLVSKVMGPFFSLDRGEWQWRGGFEMSSGFSGMVGWIEVVRN